MRQKSMKTDEKITSNFFATTQRCMNTVRAKKMTGHSVGGTVQSLERLLDINIDMAELRTDDYVCAVMLSSTLASKAPRKLEDEEIDEDLRPRNFIGHKENITFYVEPMLADGNIMIFTDERIITAKWKHR